MHYNSMFPSKYHRACDLDEPIVLTVKGVEMEEMQDGKVKPCLKFSDSDKSLILNKVNAGVLARLYGDHVDGWSGKPIRLIATTTPFQGKEVDCIRLRPPQPEAAKTQAPLDDMDDEIPFS